MKRITCKDCRYWDVMGWPGGFCRRVSPGRWELSWPETSAADWCGEAKPIKKASKKTRLVSAYLAAEAAARKSDGCKHHSGAVRYSYEDAKWYCKDCRCSWVDHPGEVK